MTEGLIKITEFGKFVKNYHSGQVPVPFMQKIFLTECEIAGTGYVDKIEEKVKLLSKGTVISLVREAENKYDSLAIRTDGPQGEKLGYIPRRENKILARLMDGGKFLYAEIDSVETSEYSNWVNITIRIFMKDF